MLLPPPLYAGAATEADSAKRFKMPPPTRSKIHLFYQLSRASSDRNSTSTFQSEGRQKPEAMQGSFRPDFHFLYNLQHH